MLRQPFFRYGTWSPWQEMERLHREMNRLFSSANPNLGMGTAPTFPAMNVWSNNEGAVVTAELPGVNPEDVDISVVGDTLTLTGSRQPESLQEGEKYHRQERGYGKFTRTIQLPFAVETDKVEAIFKHGVLHISLPCAESEKPKKIAVKTA